MSFGTRIEQALHTPKQQLTWWILLRASAGFFCVGILLLIVALRFQEIAWIWFSIIFLLGDAFLIKFIWKKYRKTGVVTYSDRIREWLSKR